MGKRKSRGARADASAPPRARIRARGASHGWAAELRSISEGLSALRVAPASESSVELQRAFTWAALAEITGEVYFDEGGGVARDVDLDYLSAKLHDRFIFSNSSTDAEVALFIRALLFAYRGDFPKSQTFKYKEELRRVLLNRYFLPTQPIEDRKKKRIDSMAIRGWVLRSVDLLEGGRGHKYLARESMLSFATLLPHVKKASRPDAQARVLGGIKSSAADVPASIRPPGPPPALPEEPGLATADCDELHKQELLMYRARNCQPSPLAMLNYPDLMRCYRLKELLEDQHEGLAAKSLQLLRDADRESAPRFLLWELTRRQGARSAAFCVHLLCEKMGIPLLEADESLNPFAEIAALAQAPPLAAGEHSFDTSQAAFELVSFLRGVALARESPSGRGWFDALVQAVGYPPHACWTELAAARDGVARATLERKAHQHAEWAKEWLAGGTWRGHPVPEMLKLSNWAAEGMRPEVDRIIERCAPREADGAPLLPELLRFAPDELARAHSKFQRSRELKAVLIDDEALARGLGCGPAEAGTSGSAGRLVAAVCAVQAEGRGRLEEFHEALIADGDLAHAMEEFGVILRESAPVALRRFALERTLHVNPPHLDFEKAALGGFPRFALEGALLRMEFAVMPWAMHEPSVCCAARRAALGDAWRSTAPRDPAARELLLRAWGCLWRELRSPEIVDCLLIPELKAAAERVALDEGPTFDADVPIIAWADRLESFQLPARRLVHAVSANALRVAASEFGDARIERAAAEDPSLENQASIVAREARGLAACTAADLEGSSLLAYMARDLIQSPSEVSPPAPLHDENAGAVQ